MSEPESRYYYSQRLKLHYAVWGDEGKPPLILIHGGRDHGRNWDRVALALNDRYTIYAPDLRGHGDSGWALGSMYSLPEFVLDVATLVAELGEDPLTVIGHSLGGAIALQYAGTFPDRVLKVVAIEGLGPPMIEHQPAHLRMRHWIDHMHEMERRQPRRYASVEDATHRMLEANPHLTAEMAHHLTLHGTRDNDDGTLSWKFDNYVHIRSPYEFNLEDAQDIWSRIQAPVLLIRGTESWAPDPEKSGRAVTIGNYRSVTVQDAGHWVHHDQLERFLEVVMEFLGE
ncbi:MAG: alpha/beta hydrolase [Chloroflexi bacterium]|nr:alpha/beta hydrolase [Chloroflexota bacterium]MCH7577160.1 alpha/beta hydrolase [Chloroflexota bacterium]